MKKFSFLSLLIAIVMVGAVVGFTSCKEKDPVEDPNKFDLAKVNFAKDGNLWVLTQFQCYDIPNDNHEKDEIDYYVSYEEAVLVFSGNSTNMHIIEKRGEQRNIYSFGSGNVSWNAGSRNLTINTYGDQFSGTVLLKEDAEKVYFEYKGVGTHGNNAQYNFVMDGYYYKVRH